MEDGERRSETGDGPRIVRVGTHALKDGSQTTLWKRLSQHCGSSTTSAANAGAAATLSGSANRPDCTKRHQS